MVGRRLQGTQGSDKAGKRAKAPAGLRLIARDGCWHISGTVRVKGHSVRIRKSTELPARDELRGTAGDILRTIEQEIADQIIYGIRPSRALAIAATEYLGLDAQGQPLPGSRAAIIGPTDRAIMAELIEALGGRRLDKITLAEWNALADRRHAGNSRETRIRWLNPILAFLGWCAAEPRCYVPSVPPIEKGPQAAKERGRRRHRKRRNVADLTPELLAFLFGFAPIHLKAQLYAEWSTGARVSSVLFGCALGDLLLSEHANQITFHDTKNGERVTAALHPATVAVLQDYLAWRGRLHERDKPLFLTDCREPYSRRGLEQGWGGANKQAFRAMRRRAILAKLRASVKLRRAGELEAALAAKGQAKLLRQVTQHWLRHWFATYAQAAGMPLRLVMEQGGWRDERSVLGYQHDVPAVRRRLIEALPIGTEAPASSPAAGKKEA